MLTVFFLRGGGGGDGVLCVVCSSGPICYAF